MSTFKHLRILASRCRILDGHLQNGIRFLSTAVNQHPVNDTPPPVLEGSDKIYSPKLVKIVDDISSLTLLEVSELNELLKKTLNISDMPMMAATASPLPAENANEDDAPAVKEQTEFTVKLNSFQADSKIKVIKAIKSLLPDLNLVKAKGFVETLPQVVRKDVPKEEAEDTLKILTEAGGTAIIE